MTVPFACRHPFGLAFVFGASLGVSCWAARSPSRGARGLALGALAATLPLLRTAKSLFPSLIAMLQLLDPKKENEIKSSGYRRADKYMEKTGKILENSSVQTRGLPGAVRTRKHLQRNQPTPGHPSSFLPGTSGALTWPSRRLPSTSCAFLLHPAPPPP